MVTSNTSVISALPVPALGCFGLGWANVTSLVRMGLALWVCLALWQGEQEKSLLFLATVAVIAMDGLDGFIARALKESSTAGAVVDILSDRCVEQFYWVTFAALGWVPLWMSLLVLLRGVWVDGLRALALQQGFTAFGSSSLMRHPVGVLLVSSRFSRWTYAACKALGFSLLILANGQGESYEWLAVLQTFALWSALPLLFITFVFCWLRGLPVLVEGRRFWNAQPVTASSEVTE